MHFGSNSPIKICTKVRSAKAKGNAIVSIIVASGVKPKNNAIRVMSPPSASWPIQPSASPAPVMANCVAERYFSRFSTMCRASFAVLCHSFSLRASCDCRTLTSANSVATKKALKPMRSIVISNAELGSGVIFCYCRTFILFRKRCALFYHNSWPKFWMSNLTAEISHVAKSYDEDEIYYYGYDKKGFLICEFLAPENKLPHYSQKSYIAYLGYHLSCLVVEECIVSPSII